MLLEILEAVKDNTPDFDGLNKNTFDDIIYSVSGYQNLEEIFSINFGSYDNNY